MLTATLFNSFEGSSGLSLPDLLTDFHTALSRAMNPTVHLLGLLVRDRRWSTGR